MGTNYYAQPKPYPNACQHCSGRSAIHIGKSLTMMQGYRINPFDRTDDAILSWADWRQALRMDAVGVIDEYDRVSTVEGFISDVEGTRRQDRERQYRWVVDHESGSGDWLDFAGFSFTFSEFS